MYVSLTIFSMLSRKTCSRFLLLRKSTVHTGQVYFLMEAVLGGELYALLKKHGKFTEPQAKFYTAQVVAVFEHFLCFLAGQWGEVGLGSRDWAPHFFLGSNFEVPENSQGWFPS